MNPFAKLIGIPLALFGAIAFLARPAHAPEKERKGLLPLYVSGRLHIASPEVTRRLKGSYPETVAALARKWGSVFAIPVSWLRSQAYAESRNKPTALRESSGAMGVLQLLPDTALWLVESLGKSAFAANEKVVETLSVGWHRHLDDLYNPDLNVMLAAYYMTLLRKRFGSRHDLVAAAYNVGPNRVADRLQAGKSLPTRSLIYVTMVEDAKKRGFR